MIPGIEQKMKTLLAMHKCERCGRCCNHERVTVSPEDIRRNRKLSGAIESRIAYGYATLRLPCPFVIPVHHDISFCECDCHTQGTPSPDCPKCSGKYQCTCYSTRPFPCRLYPLFEKYPGYVSISQCPFGDQIIAEVLEFCELNGIPTEDADAKKDIMEMDQAYRDLGVGQAEAQLCISIPALIFDGFYKWLMDGKK